MEALKKCKSLAARKKARELEKREEMRVRSLNKLSNRARQRRRFELGLELKEETAAKERFLSPSTPSSTTTS